MSRWQSHIDQILGDARARAAGQDSASKTASAPSVLDAAKEAADALDFVAHQDPSTGSPLRQFFVEKAALAPTVTPTMTTGEQVEPPRKTRTPAASPSSGARPAVSVAPAGQMPVMPLSQEGGALVAKKATAAGAGMSPPAQHGMGWSPIARGPQDDPQSWSPGQWTPANAKVASQAEGTTLFDIVMQGRTASKEAMSPAQYVGGEDSGAAPSANEGALTRFLASNEAAVDYTKRDAKLPTRARIKEVFQNVDDPANGEAARAAFPNASALGGLKVAGVRLSEAGHREQARRADIIGKAARELASAKRDYMAANPLSANLRGHAGSALQHEMLARHMAYQKGKHSEGRQSLNPFGGLLTPLKKEGAIRFSEAGHKEEAAIAKAKSRAASALADSSRQHMTDSPMSALLRGRPAEALGHELEARHQAYKARQHGEKRQSLNPFGGLLTPVKKEAAFRFSDKGHAEEARRSGILRDREKAIFDAKKEYMAANPLGAALRGRDADVLSHTLAARHQAYKARQHGDKRQSLNPFGGLLTPLKKEGAVRFSRAGHADETRQQKALVRMHSALAESDRQHMVDSPISASLRGRPATALQHEIAARRAAYKVRQHSDRRQALNPFGGLLTPVTNEGK